MNTKVLHNLTCGLYVLSSRSGEKRSGCIINTVMQVTSRPLRITITVNKANYTHDLIAQSGVFTVSLLDQSAPFGLFQHFGFQSGRDVDKFKDLGSHTQFLADVIDCDTLPGAEPVSYAYYQANIKPKPQEKSTVKGWRCTICGYIYEGETLPEDFICPLCKHGVEAFEKIE